MNSVLFSSSPSDSHNWPRKKGKFSRKKSRQTCPYCSPSWQKSGGASSPPVEYCASSRASASANAHLDLRTNPMPFHHVLLGLHQDSVVLPLSVEVLHTREWAGFAYLVGCISLPTDKQPTFLDSIRRASSSLLWPVLWNL